ncbi:MAG: DUF4982 domain-containing protein [Clostridia bacterium]|nr:DUF4982 domain-containing protein [Clostridia bacterium]
MRSKTLFNDNWLFHMGDISTPVPTDKGPVYMQSKTERYRQGPASKDYNAEPDSFAENGEYNPDKWEKISLPHDYIISQAPVSSENNALGFFTYENAWYRKKFVLPEEDKDKRITVLFEGVATACEIYLNGALLKRNFCGYTSFEVDLSDLVLFGEENVLSVYVDAKQYEGWWYNGGGIYRNVWLVKTNKISVDLWGLYAAPKKLDEKNWCVRIETTVRNDLTEPAEVTVRSSIKNADGVIGEGVAKVSVPPMYKAEAVCFVQISDPRLWDIDDTYLHTVSSSVEAEGKITDEAEESFGFREVVINPDTGLYLNGRHVKIKGVCSHQDFGLTGKAVPDNIHRHKISLIKEMGANGYRCSHYPHPQAVMDELDRQGFIVMDETRWFNSSDECIEQLEMLVKRDRNHPSVMFWSLGNEEPVHMTEQGAKIYERMAAAVRRLDSTRPITSAVSNNPAEATVCGSLDIIGVNYNLDQYDMLRQKFPDKPIFSSECCATGTTRGWYFEDCEEKAFISSYDHDTNQWFRGRENTWKFITERDWVLGSYQWIAFEHRGEAVWPRVCSQSGAIDLFLQKKDAFYQNQSHWIEDRPIVHLLPHWNHFGMEGTSVTVFAYTNCDELELFLNGRSLGRKKIEKYGHGSWEVIYEPGELSVTAYKNGIAEAFDKQVTTGRAKTLKLSLENTVSDANGVDIALITCSCIDENGLEVPDASPLVSFACNNLGTIVGTGSSVTDHTPVPSTERKMYAGKISAAVRVGKTPGILKVYASNESLGTKALEIELH